MFKNVLLALAAALACTGFSAAAQQPPCSTLVLLRPAQGTFTVPCLQSMLPGTAGIECLNCPGMAVVLGTQLSCVQHFSDFISVSVPSRSYKGHCVPLAGFGAVPMAPASPLAVHGLPAPRAGSAMRAPSPVAPPRAAPLQPAPMPPQMAPVPHIAPAPRPAPQPRVAPQPGGGQPRGFS